MSNAKVYKGESLADLLVEHDPFLNKGAMACAGKRRFANFVLAERVRVLEITARLPKGSKLAVYKCSECYGWHLTKRKGHDAVTPRVRDKL